MATLQIGDRIYSRTWDGIERVHTIDRVTKTLAIAKDIRFKIDHNNGLCQLQSPTAWSRTSYKLETKELRDEWKRKKLISTIELSTKDTELEKLERIYQIISNKS